MCNKKLNILISEVWSSTPQPIRENIALLQYLLSGSVKMNVSHTGHTEIILIYVTHIKLKLICMDIQLSFFFFFFFFFLSFFW